MTTNAELLIRIGADPSNAEASILRFRQNFSRDLGGLGTELERWSVVGSQDFNRVRAAALSLGTTLAQAVQTAGPLSGQLTEADKAVQTLASHWNVSLTAVNQILNRNRQIGQLWKTELVANFAEVLNASQVLETSLVRSFLIFDSALGTNLANAVIWQKTIGEAFRQAALQAVSSIAQEALVRAIYATALGFYLLAIQDYRGAALAFESAAIYGLIGGAAALAGRALAGPDVREAAGGATVRQPGAVAPDYIISGQGANAAPTNPQPTLQVIFQGPVYGGQRGIDELVNAINQAVDQRGTHLVATRLVNGQRMS